MNIWRTKEYKPLEADSWYIILSLLMVFNIGNKTYSEFHNLFYDTIDDNYATIVLYLYLDIWHL